MMITEGIQSRLRALGGKSQFNDAGARVISAKLSPKNAARFLSEISESILARTLKFSNDSGAILEIEVVGRRVLRVLDVQGLSTQTGIEELVEKPLSETEDLDGLLQMIRDFTTNANQIAVISTPLEMGFGEIIIGLPVAHISRGVLGDQYRSEFSPISSHAAYDILMHLDAVDALIITNSDDDDMSFGEPEVVATLGQYVEGHIEEIQTYLDQFSEKPGKRACTVIGQLSGKNAAMICLRTKGQLAFAIIPGDSVETLLNSWKMENQLG